MRVVFSSSELLKSFLPRSSQECSKVLDRAGTASTTELNNFFLYIWRLLLRAPLPKLGRMDFDVRFLCINVAKDFSAILHLNVSSLEKYHALSSETKVARVGRAFGLRDSRTQLLKSFLPRSSQECRLTNAGKSLKAEDIRIGSY